MLMRSNQVYTAEAKNPLRKDKYVGYCEIISNLTREAS